MPYKFKKGSKVEVLNKKEGHLCSWLRAKIISGNGHTYVVCYDHFVPEIGGTLERVPRKAIRPCPPSIKRPLSLVPGSLVEVLYKKLWQPAEVLRVDDEGYYMVTLLVYYREIIALETEVRLPQSWQNGKWDILQKVSDKHNNPKEIRLTEEGCGSNELNQYLRGKKSSRPNHEICKKEARKIRTAEEERRLTKLVSNEADYMDAESACFDRFGATKSHADNTETSSGTGRMQFLPTSKIEDTEKFLPTRKIADPEIHRLQLHSYRAILFALYASGPLSWEGETLITNLRGILNVSNDEHLLVIRKLLSHGKHALVRL